MEISLAIIIAVFAAHLLAVASPGPDFFVVVKNALAGGRRVGVWTAVGIALGLIVHILYSLFGLAYIISQSLILFTVIKLLGASYLIYIGCRSLRAKGGEAKTIEHEEKREISWSRALKTGFITNTLNPKAALYFLSLFTLVISPETSTATLVIISMGLVLLTGVWFALVALFFSQKNVQQVYLKSEGVFNKIFGSILIGLGLKLASTSNS